MVRADDEETDLKAYKKLEDEAKIAITRNMKIETDTSNSTWQRWQWPLEKIDETAAIQNKVFEHIYLGVKDGNLVLTDETNAAQFGDHRGYMAIFNESHEVDHVLGVNENGEIVLQVYNPELMHPSVYFRSDGKICLYSEQFYTRSGDDVVWLALQVGVSRISNLTPGNVVRLLRCLYEVCTDVSQEMVNNPNEALRKVYEARFNQAISWFSWIIQTYDYGESDEEKDKILRGMHNHFVVRTFDLLFNVIKTTDDSYIRCSLVNRLETFVDCIATSTVTYLQDEMFVVLRKVTHEYTKQICGDFRVFSIDGPALAEVFDIGVQDEYRVVTETTVKVIQTYKTVRKEGFEHTPLEILTQGFGVVFCLNKLWNIFNYSVRYRFVDNDKKFDSVKPYMEEFYPFFLDQCLTRPLCSVLKIFSQCHLMTPTYYRNCWEIGNWMLTYLLHNEAPIDDSLKKKLAYRTFRVAECKNIIDKYPIPPLDCVVTKTLWNGRSKMIVPWTDYNKWDKELLKLGMEFVEECFKDFHVFDQKRLLLLNQLRAPNLVFGYLVYGFLDQNQKVLQEFVDLCLTNPDYFIYLSFFDPLKIYYDFRPVIIRRMFECEDREKILWNKVFELYQSRPLLFDVKEWTSHYNDLFEISSKVISDPEALESLREKILQFWTQILRTSTKQNQKTNMQQFLVKLMVQLEDPNCPRATRTFLFDLMARNPNMFHFILKDAKNGHRLLTIANFMSVDNKEIWNDPNQRYKVDIRKYKEVASLKLSFEAQDMNIYSNFIAAALDSMIEVGYKAWSACTNEELIKREFGIHLWEEKFGLFKNTRGDWNGFWLNQRFDVSLFIFNLYNAAPWCISKKPVLYFSNFLSNTQGSMEFLLGHLETEQPDPKPYVSRMEMLLHCLTTSFRNDLASAFNDSGTKIRNAFAEFLWKDAVETFEKSKQTSIAESRLKQVLNNVHGVMQNLLMKFVVTNFKSDCKNGITKSAGHAFFGDNTFLRILYARIAPNNLQLLKELIFATEGIKNCVFIKNLSFSSVLTLHNKRRDSFSSALSNPTEELVRKEADKQRKIAEEVAKNVEFLTQMLDFVEAETENSECDKFVDSLISKLLAYEKHFFSSTFWQSDMFKDHEDFWWKYRVFQYKRTLLASVSFDMKTDFILYLSVLLNGPSPNRFSISSLKDIALLVEKTCKAIAKVMTWESIDQRFYAVVQLAVLDVLEWVACLSAAVAWDESLESKKWDMKSMKKGRDVRIIDPKHPQSGRRVKVVSKGKEMILVKIGEKEEEFTLAQLKPAEVSGVTFRWRPEFLRLWDEFKTSPSPDVRASVLRMATEWRNITEWESKCLNLARNFNGSFVVHQANLLKSYETIFDNKNSDVLMEESKL